MATPEHIRQQQYRERRAKRIAAMEAGLRAIVDKLGGNTKPLAVEIHALALDALGEEEGKAKP